MWKQCRDTLCVFYNGYLPESTDLAILTLTSYSRYNGIVTKTRVFKPGGVIIAATSIDNMLGIGFNVVSRLRHDAALYYLWDGEPTGNPGRPRVKGGKIDFKNIDKSNIAILDTDKSNGQVYALKAWCKFLHRQISLVIHILPKGGHWLYFSTDESMSGRDVMEYYCTRFQIKFYFRDEKQFVGLTDCLAYDTRKLDFAFNSSFTAVNVAKIMCRECNISIGRLKVLKINADYDQRIIDVFENNPNTQLNHEIVNEKLGFAADVA